MECLSFQEYCDTGGLWMVACREPEEDVGDAESSGALEQDSFEEQFFDNRTRKPLDAEKVRAARAEELRELDRRVWEEADLQECFDKEGRGPIGIRLVDVDKGFGVYRSRLVAKDFKPRSKIDDKEGLVAATRPLELVKVLIMKAARAKNSCGASTRKIMFLDISNAHLYAPMLDEEFVELSPERWKEGKCARLIYTLYGMRTVSNWEKENSKTSEEVGFQNGRGTVVAFFLPERDIRIIVHGDDFVVEGEQSDLEWVRDVLAAKYLLTVRGILVPETCDQKSMVILGSAVEWRADELWWEADTRHVETNSEVCGMTSGNPSVLTGVKLLEEEGDDQPLVGEELARYRPVAATANFIAQDRPDVKFAVEELCRDMAKPTFASWRKMKKLARYFKGQPRIVQKIKFDIDGSGTEANVIVDSDWAGCASTRKSTNGGCIMVGDAEDCRIEQWRS